MNYLKKAHPGYPSPEGVLAPRQFSEEGAFHRFIGFSRFSK
jgi:hypothetical protein